MEKVSRSVSIRTLIILFVVILLIMGGVSAYVLSQRRQATQVPTSVLQELAKAQMVSPENEELLASISVNVIQPLLLPCRFDFLKACIDKYLPNGVEDDEPEKNEYEEFAWQDTLRIVESQEESSLKNFSSTMTNDQLKTYFPDKYRYFENGQTPIDAGTIVYRVGAHHNVNPRVLLVLTEVLHQGKGPLRSKLTPAAEAYFAQRGDFPTQVISVAKELSELRTKYYLEKLGNRFPQKLTFFNKVYTVAPGVKPEDMAIVHFLANHLTNARDFERAIRVPSLHQENDPALLTDPYSFNYQFEMVGGNPLAQP